jgi:hypothetical protein
MQLSSSKMRWSLIRQQPRHRLSCKIYLTGVASSKLSLGLMEWVRLCSPAFKKTAQGTTEWTRVLKSSWDIKVSPCLRAREGLESYIEEIMMEKLIDGSNHLNSIKILRKT